MLPRLSPGTLLSLAATALTAMVAAMPLAAEDDPPGEPASFAQALTQGKAWVNLRYRFEMVDEEDRFDERAEASTLRTTVSYRTAAYQGWSLFLEAEDVTAVVDDDEYNNAGGLRVANRVRDRPVVADPQLTEMNQAYVRFQNDRLQATLGRQEIVLGDSRFVGNVGWRQNHQSFDAVRLELEASPRVTLDYAFLENVNRIFGDNKDMASHLLTVPIQITDDVRVTPYGYLLDYQERLDFRLSTQTLGVELQGQVPLGDRTQLLWEAEYANQADTGDNPDNIDADYLLASLGFGFGGGFKAQATWELLGAEPGDGAFQTPLATLHKFNGWADKFLVTPSVGLETLYLRLSGPLGPVQWMLVYHDFQADSLDVDFGTELDGELKYTSPWKQTFAFKFALYEADRFATDTEKVMLWTSYKF